MKTRAAWRALEQFHQPGGILIWQRPNQGRINKRKNGYAGANSEGKSDDCGHGKAGVSAQLPQRKPQILKSSFDSETYYFVTLLVQSCRVPKLSPRSEASILCPHPFIDKCARCCGTMKVHLFIQLVAKSSAP